MSKKRQNIKRLRELLKSIASKPTKKVKPKKEEPKAEEPKAKEEKPKKKKKVVKNDD